MNLSLLLFHWSTLVDFKDVERPTMIGTVLSASNRLALFSGLGYLATVTKTKKTLIYANQKSVVWLNK